jgi:membrane dipeptidase
MRRIVDSHLDLAWDAISLNRDLTEPLARINRREEGMTDFPGRARATVSLDELRSGGVAVCLGVVLSRTNRHKQTVLRKDVDSATQDIAYAMAQGQLGYYRALEARGLMNMLRTRADLRRHWTAWSAAPAPDLPVGFVLAAEGADCILEPQQLIEWWRDGLRVVALAHYGPGVYAAGTGAGGPVTDRGQALLAEMRRLGMILDVTHLCERCFFQALELFDGPVLASHNNCRALVPDERQFSDDQIRLLVRRQAVIGVALDNWMLCPQYQRGRTPRAGIRLSNVADHIDHICRLAGDTLHAAIGSDLDGGYGSEQCPEDLDSIADLQKLDGILARRGYAAADLDNIFHANWLRLLEQSLPQER